MDRESSQEQLGFSIEQRVTTDIATHYSKEPTMHNTHPIPATRNDAWGFWGTMNEQAAVAWPLAMIAISEATCQPLESVQLFLDSCHGRHFADKVQNGLYKGQSLVDAIGAATQQWMSWTISHQISQDYGIPRGLPYLTGFVIHCELIEESLSA